MSDKIEFKMLDYECISKDTVTFKLEDDTIVKIKVDLDRVGIATNYRNPDGTPHYMINTSVKVKTIPNDRRFSVDKSHMRSSNIPSHIA